MTHDRSERIEVHFGQDKDGRWVAATSSSPYFYLESDSETEARKAAEDAIRFYAENRDKLPPESPDRDQARKLPTFSNVKTEKLCA